MTQIAFCHLLKSQYIVNIPTYFFNQLYVLFCGGLKYRVLKFKACLIYLSPPFFPHSTPGFFSRLRLLSLLSQGKVEREIMPHRKEKDYLLVKNPSRLN